MANRIFLVEVLWQFLCVIALLISTYTEGGNGEVISGSIGSAVSSNETEIQRFNESTLLPDTWKDMCAVDQAQSDSVYVQCSVNANTSGIWRLDILKYYIGVSNVNYHFKITCKPDTKVSLSWPLKAEHLLGLEVIGCIITDFLSNTNFKFIPQGNHPDQLQSLTFTDCQIQISVMGYMTLMMNVEEIPKDFDCGQENTIESITWRNVSYTFDQKEIQKILESTNAGANNTGGNDSYVMPDIIKVGTEYLDKTRRIEHKCDFRKLRYVDQSISSSKSKYSMSVLTENSFFPEVRVYNLSKTSMTEIKDQFKQWWRYFPKLEMLDVSHNFIRGIDFDDSASAWDTAYLLVNLTSNNISSLSVSTVKMLASIPNLFVDIRGNPFKCDCSPEMKELIHFLKASDIWKSKPYARYTYMKGLICKSPKTAKGKSFIDLQESDMMCELASASATTTIVLLSTMVVVLMLTIIILTKFRHEIQILTYTRFHIILPCQLKEQYQQSKTYDAFVSYSSDDEVWVTKTFQALEDTEVQGSKSFKFCLHQRDFIAGRTIFDNIIDSVEASRHTVIVLSKNFLKSHWCLYEFQEAFQQSILERSRHLVVIMMENIPSEDMPKELKRCLKTFTYIKKDDAIFTDRLVYALSVNDRKSPSRRSEKISETAVTISSDSSDKHASKNDIALHSTIASKSTLIDEKGNGDSGTCDISNSTSEHFVEINLATN